MSDFVDDWLDESFEGYLSRPDSDSGQYRIISDVVKEYPDMIQIFIYHNSYALTTSSKKQKVSLTNEQRKEVSIHRSVRRSRSAITDLILCNRFDLWCTFTFDKRYIDRYDIKRCKSKMSLWLHRNSMKYKDFAYLIVPEFHADGALHFHAFIRGYGGRLADSGKKTKTKQPIFNISGYRSGWSTAVKIDENLGQLTNYVLKQYITKDMPLLYGKKRYWTSRNLKTPTKTVNGVAKFRLGNLIKNNKPLYVTENFEVQQFSKALNVPLTSSISDTLF